MSARRKFQLSEAQATSSTPSRQKNAAVPGDGEEAVIEGVRTQWVQDRREELDRVFDTHDTLVRSPDLISSVDCAQSSQIREAFHLEKFVSLLTYDLKVCALLYSKLLRMWRERD